MVVHGTKWEFPKLRGALFWGPKNPKPSTPDPRTIISAAAKAGNLSMAEYWYEAPGLGVLRQRSRRVFKGQGFGFNLGLVCRVGFL